MKKNKVNVIGFANREAVDFATYLINFGAGAIAGGALLMVLGTKVFNKNTQWYGGANEEAEQNIGKLYDAISSKAN